MTNLPKENPPLAGAGAGAGAGVPPKEKPPELGAGALLSVPIKYI